MDLGWPVGSRYALSHEQKNCRDLTKLTDSGSAEVTQLVLSQI